MSSWHSTIKYKGKVIAHIVRSHFQIENVKFLTPVENPLQVSLHHQLAGAKILPHVHKAQDINITDINEVIYVIKGKIKLTMYAQRTGQKIQSVILKTGDSVIHLSEGLGLEFLQESVVFEVKQGPYMEVETTKLYL